MRSIAARSATSATMHSSFGAGSAIGLHVGQTQVAPVGAQTVAQRGADRTGGAGDRSVGPGLSAPGAIMQRSGSPWAARVVLDALHHSPSAHRATRSTAPRYSSMPAFLRRHQHVLHAGRLVGLQPPAQRAGVPAVVRACAARSVNAASGRPARRRCTIAGACSGVTRLPCQPSSRSARAIAASDEPPIQIGIGAHGLRLHAHRR